MSAQRFHRVKDIFLNACELEPAARSAFLAETCGSDLALRAEVENLLANDADPLTLVSPGHVRSQLQRMAAEFEPGHTGGAGNSGGGGIRGLPDRIGCYRVVRKIGEGGMGVVYLAEQDRPRRTVALKLIAPGRATRQVLRRFEHEAQVLGRLQHPGIAQIFEAGTFDAGHGQQPFFAMEFVSGQTLTAFAGRKQLSTRQRLILFVMVCEAVEHAHQKGVIHRDLKPANILVDEGPADGQPKILDFGVARATDADLQVTTQHTSASQLIGTIAYMSPEQIAGDARELDTRSDVYALGVILFELLAGRLPHDLAGKTIPETIRIVGQDEPSSLGSVNRIFRGDLDTIVAKALEKDKSRRYQSARALAADIQSSLNDEPIEARRHSALYVLRKSMRRYRLQFAALAAVILVIAASAIVAWTLYGRTRTAEHRAVENFRESLIAQARAGRRSGMFGQRNDSLAAVRQAAAIQPTMDARNEAIAAMAMLDLRPLAPPAGSGAAIWYDRHLTVSAMQAEDGQVTVRRLGDDAVVAVVPPPRMPVDPVSAWIRMYVSAGLCVRLFDPIDQPRRLEVWRLPETELILEVSDIPDRSRFDVSPDERLLAVPRLDSAIHFYELSSGREVRSLPVEHNAGYVAFDPAGRRLVRFHGRDVNALVIDLDSGESTPIFPGSQTQWALAWSPDGSLIAGVEGHVIYLWDTVSHRAVGELAKHTDIVVGLAFSPDGDRLVSCSWDGTSIVWDVRRRTPLLRVTGMLTAWAPDGRLGGALGASPIMYQIESGRQFNQLIGRPEGDRQLAACYGVFDPGGRLLYTCNSNASGLRIFDVAGRCEAACVASGRIDAIQLDADRHELMTFDRHGLLRWPIVHEPGEARIGPPVLVNSDPAVGITGAQSDQFSLNADGRVAIVSLQPVGSEVMVIDPRTGSVLKNIQTLPRANKSVVSPDGRWMATGTWQGTGGEVWDLQTMQRVAQLPLDGSALVMFSPDSKVLATSDRQELALWRADSWTRISGIPWQPCSPLVFDPTGRILATLAHGAGKARLIDTQTMTELATLEPPDGLPSWAVLFSPDGRTLAILTRQSNVVYLWNLPAIRAELATMGLDWDMPAYEPRPAGPVTPLRVEVDPGDLLSQAK